MLPMIGQVCKSIGLTAKIQVLHQCAVVVNDRFRVEHLEFYKLWRDQDLLLITDSLVKVVKAIQIAQGFQEKPHVPTGLNVQPVPAEVHALILSKFPEKFQDKLRLYTAEELYYVYRICTKRLPAEDRSSSAVFFAAIRAKTFRWLRGEEERPVYPTGIASLIVRGWKKDWNEWLDSQLNPPPAAPALVVDRRVETPMTVVEAPKAKPAKVIYIPRDESKMATLGELLKHHREVEQGDEGASHAA